MAQEEPHNLCQLLDRLASAGDDGRPVTLGDLLDTVGRRAFGPLLMVPGLIAISPLSGIPGMPSTLGVLVVLIAGQLLLGRRHFWMPDVLLKRHISHRKRDKAVRFLRPVARFVDRLLRPRLRLLTEGPAVYLVAGACVLLAATMPPLELLPFAATLAGAGITTFGLALIAHDGLFALIALCCCAAALGVLIVSVF